MPRWLARLLRRPPVRPAIPPYKAPDPVQVRTERAPKDEGIEVEEVDTTDLTRTGIFKAWKRMTGGDD